MIPTIEKVKDMKSRFPALNNHIIKLEERYKILCKIIDSSSIDEESKAARKNAYYIFLIVIKKLMVSDIYNCFVSIKDNGVQVNCDEYKIKYNEDLLATLFRNYDLIENEYYGDHSLIWKISLTHEKVRERISEN